MDNDSMLEVVLGIGALAVAAATVVPILSNAISPSRPPDSDE